MTTERIITIGNMQLAYTPASKAGDYACAILSKANPVGDGWYIVKEFIGDDADEIANTLQPPASSDAGEYAREIQRKCTGNGYRIDDDKLPCVISIIHSYGEHLVAPLNNALGAAQHLMDCANAIVGADTSDERAADAFDMFIDAKDAFRRSLYLATSRQPLESSPM